MTRERAKELLPILQAYANGKPIQVANLKGWETVENPSFDAHPTVYRVKPEPRDFWLVDFQAGNSPHWAVLEDAPSKEVAETHDVIHVREVLPE